MYVLPVVTLIVGFVVKRIKPEDKNLFKQLKEFKYSSFSFSPKDNTKIAFVPVFSILFPAIFAKTTLISLNSLSYCSLLASFLKPNNKP